MNSTLFSFIKKWFPLFLITSISLFLELAVIRWLSGEIRILAYFKNLPLLAAFLGLAIGFSLVNKGKDSRSTFPLFWGIFVLLVLLIGQFSRYKNMVFPGSGNIYFWETAEVSFWTSLIVFLLFICIFFFLTLFLFIPLGQATGEEMAKHSPIPAYIANIIASLVGVWAFSLISFLETSPWIWFGVALIGFSLYYYLTFQKFNYIHSILFLLSLLGIWFFNRQDIWSPYNRLQINPLPYSRQDGTQGILGYQIDVQSSFYQLANNLSSSFVEQLKAEKATIDYVDFVESHAAGYNLPYSFSSAGNKVLIVGSGSGNDVAAALRADMGEIDAVEIDQSILNIGRRLHPEMPYADQRVKAIIDDARSYFNKTNEHYDLIVFGLLDSHTLLSGMSSVRLDSFVYTMESFQKASQLLNPGGYIVVTFAANEWIEQRLGRMLSQVFGSQNILYKRWSGDWYITFIAGLDRPVVSSDLGLADWQADPAFDNISLTTDDWPYIYQRSRQITPGYLQTLIVIGLLCLLLTVRSFPDVLHPDWQFFLLGAAFLLIEFKSITELALLFGTTWFVNSLAISGVLLMALGANIFVLLRPRINLSFAYALLFAAIAIGFFFPLQSLAGLSAPLKALLGTTLLCLPLFFSGIVFSESLRRAGETARPLASNFAGSAAGGLLEYASSIWGIKSLYFVAALLYLGALASLRNRKG